MLTQLTAYVRKRWHPLWRLRRLALYRRFQRKCDRTVWTSIPGTGLRVAVKLLRDASWIAGPANLEPEIRTAFELVLRWQKPAVFWDVGANIGFYSWLVRRQPSIREVVMFEPDPVNHALVTETIRQNGIQDCRALKIALSDRCGETTFLVDHASGATGSLEAISHRDNQESLHHAYQMSETIKCQTDTVDGLIAKGLPAPDLIKIDVEGAEHLVIAGALTTLDQHRPTLIVETTDLALVHRLTALGYCALCIDAGNVLFVPRFSDAGLTPYRDAFSEHGQSTPLGTTMGSLP